MKNCSFLKKKKKVLRKLRNLSGGWSTQVDINRGAPLKLEGFITKAPLKLEEEGDSDSRGKLLDFATREEHFSTKFPNTYPDTIC